MMYDEQKKSPDTVTTRTGQNNRNLQTVGTETIARSGFYEQLSRFETLEQKE